jgi:hypothetical protein
MCSRREVLRLRSLQKVLKQKVDLLRVRMIKNVSKFEERKRDAVVTEESRKVMGLGKSSFYCRTTLKFIRSFK